MKSEGLLYFTDTHWTALALILFFTFFAILVMRVFFSKDTNDLENKKNMIFELAGDKHDKQTR